MKVRENAKTKLARSMRKAPTSAEAKLWTGLRRRQVKRRLDLDSSTAQIDDRTNLQP